MSQSRKTKRTKYHFKLRMLKDINCCNSNTKYYCDLREQLFTLGETNIMFQVDSKLYIYTLYNYNSSIHELYRTFFFFFLNPTEGLQVCSELKAPQQMKQFSEGKLKKGLPY